MMTVQLTWYDILDAICRGSDFSFAESYEHDFPTINHGAIYFVRYTLPLAVEIIRRYGKDWHNDSEVWRLWEEWRRWKQVEKNVVITIVDWSHFSI